MKLRRNDIVLHSNMYGRVWRRIDETHVQVINCGCMVRIYEDTDKNLVLSNDYKGFKSFRTKRLIRMTGLKQLKKEAANYNAHFGGRNAFGKKWSKQERAEALADRTAYKYPTVLTS
jgi:hypothetical protein